MYAPIIELEGDSLVIGATQDCTPIAEMCKAKHNAGEHGSGEMKHAASIPHVMVEKYCNDNGITFREWMGDKAHIRRMLNDPALAHFRIWKGQV